MRAETAARLVYNRVPGCTGHRLYGIGGHSLGWSIATDEVSVYVRDAGDGRVAADLLVVRGPGEDRTIVAPGGEAVELLVEALTAAQTAAAAAGEPAAAPAGGGHTHRAVLHEHDDGTLDVSFVCDVPPMGGWCRIDCATPSHRYLHEDTLPGELEDYDAEEYGECRPVPSRSCHLVEWLSEDPVGYCLNEERLREVWRDGAREVAFSAEWDEERYVWTAGEVIA